MLDLMRFRIHAHFCGPPAIVETVVHKLYRVFTDERLVVLSVMGAGDAADLKDVDKIAIELQFDHELDGRQVKVFEGKTIEKSTRRKQLLATNVDGVFGKIQ